MIEMNAMSGAGSLLSEIQGQIENAGSPTVAFTLMMQKQALEDRVSFKQWLHQSGMLDAETRQANERAAAALRLSRRAQGYINTF